MSIIFNLSVFDYAMLAMIFFIGLVTSWEDYRISRVRNIWIILGIVYGLVVFLFISIFSLIDSWNIFSGIDIGTVNFGYYGNVAINTAMSFFVGFVLWKMNLLAAGDAKLFFLFSFLLPLKFYWRSYFPLFPSLVLLTNIFIPLFFIIFFQASWYFISHFTYFRKHLNFGVIYMAKSATMKMSNIFKFIIIFFIAFFFIQRTFSHLLPKHVLATINSNGLLLFLLIVLYWLTNAFLLNIKKKKKVVFFVAYTLFVLFLLLDFILFPQEFYEKLSYSFTITFFFTISMKTIKWFTDYYINKSAIAMIPLNNLSPGDRLARKNFTDRDDKITKSELGKVEIIRLKEWAKKYGMKEVAIYRKLPFAIWLFIGVIITIIFKQSVISLFLNLFK